MEKIIPFSDFNSNEFAKKTLKYLEENQEELKLESATIYYKYPQFKEYNEETNYPELFVISPNHGIITINILTASRRNIMDGSIDDMLENIDELYGQVLSKFIKIPTLKKKRSRSEITIPINTFLYLPNMDFEKGNDYETYIFRSFNSLKNEIDQIYEKNDVEITSDNLTDIFSVIDGTRAIPKISKRNINNEDEESKGSILTKLDNQIAKFDQKQRIAALTIVDGPQRIRGMAGSGKTVILAMKAALIHLNNPEANILFTFYTKSLYDQIKQMITRFYRMQQDHDPNWEKIHILHAWGGKTLPGVYYNSCIDNNISPIIFKNAQQAAKSFNMSPFEFVCYDLLDKSIENIESKYDYILMDEGQDFPKSFYWLCRKLVKNDHLVWAYDELQNILNIEVQETKLLFKNTFGDEGIDLSELMKNHPDQNNDIVLHTSYRNPLEILITSQAIGFGVYNDRIVQMLENKEHWEDLGYHVEQGQLVEGEKTIISRPKENSPSIISDKFSRDEIIKTKTFTKWDDEIEYIVEEVKSSINQNLLPEDIMILCMDDRNARGYFERIASKLSESEIYTNNTLTSFSGEVFATPDKVTLTTVYRAKGNEAALVFVIGVDSLMYGQYDIISRNKLFTSFTRSKAWLRVTGSSDSSFYIYDEINQAKEYIPRLEFTYPNMTELKTLQRELARENATLNKKREELLKQLDKLDLKEEEAINILRGHTKL